MNVVIPTIGSRGDVQPFIALAQGLIRAGHYVTLATHPGMKVLVETHAVPFAPIGPDIDLGVEIAAIRQWSDNVVVGLVRAMRFGFEMLERSHDDILEHCREADLVVVPTAVAAGKNEADLLDIPYCSVTLTPWSIPYRDPERPFPKRVAYCALDRLICLITTRPLNRIRRRLGLPPVGQEGFTSMDLNLVPVSPLIYPPNPLWEDHHQVVGYWFAQTPESWQPEEDLLAFLKPDDKPLAISLGAMSLGMDDAIETASIFVQAIEKVGERAVVQGLEQGINRLTLPSSIYAAGSMPHDWLLPRCRGIVHHGGFGTTSAGLRAGIPAVVIPHIADQFYWGERIYELGVGPKPIRRNNLEVENLSVALKQLSKESKMRLTASKIGEQIRAENGVEDAVCLMEAIYIK